MRTYFVRVPQWARKIYPQAIWDSYSLYDDGRVLWTFDDGPHPDSTYSCLEFLENQGTQGIFFTSGSQAEKHLSLVADIRSQGHIIASHGYAHLDGWRTPTQIYLDDVIRSLDILETDLFRPPYGRMTLKQYQRIRDLSSIMMWSLMPGDFDQNNTSVTQVRSRCTSAQEGDIVVLHDRPECTRWMK